MAHYETAALGDKRQVLNSTGANKAAKNKPGKKKDDGEIEGEINLLLAKYAELGRRLTT